MAAAWEPIPPPVDVPVVAIVARSGSRGGSQRGQRPSPNDEWLFAAPKCGSAYLSGVDAVGMPQQRPQYGCQQQQAYGQALQLATPASLQLAPPALLRPELQQTEEERVRLREDQERRADQHRRWLEREEQQQQKLQRLQMSTSQTQFQLYGCGGEQYAPVRGLQPPCLPQVNLFGDAFSQQLPMIPQPATTTSGTPNMFAPSLLQRQPSSTNLAGPLAAGWPAPQCCGADERSGLFLKQPFVLSAIDDTRQLGRLGSDGNLQATPMFHFGLPAHGLGTSTSITSLTGTCNQAYQPGAPPASEVPCASYPGCTVPPAELAELMVAARRLLSMPPSGGGGGVAGPGSVGTCSSCLLGEDSSYKFGGHLASTGATQSTSSLFSASPISSPSGLQQIAASRYARVEQWLNRGYRSPPLVRTTRVDYPGGASIDVAALAADMMAIVDEDTWSRMAQTIDSGDHMRQALSIFRMRDTDQSGVLTWGNQEVMSFVCSVFQQYGLAPPTEMQVYHLYTHFDTTRSMSLDVRECVSLVDALLRSIFVVEPRTNLQLPLTSPDSGRAWEADFDDIPAESTGLALTCNNLKKPLYPPSTMQPIELGPAIVPSPHLVKVGSVDKTTDALNEAKAETVRLRRELAELRELELSSPHTESASSGPVPVALFSAATYPAMHPQPRSPKSQSRETLSDDNGASTPAEPMLHHHHEDNLRPHSSGKPTTIRRRNSHAGVLSNDSGRESGTEALAPNLTQRLSLKVRADGHKVANKGSLREKTPVAEGCVTQRLVAAAAAVDVSSHTSGLEEVSPVQLSLASTASLPSAQMAAVLDVARAHLEHSRLTRELQKLRVVAARQDTEVQQLCSSRNAARAREELHHAEYMRDLAERQQLQGSEAAARAREELLRAAALRDSIERQREETAKASLLAAEELRRVAELRRTVEMQQQECMAAVIERELACRGEANQLKQREETLLERERRLIGVSAAGEPQLREMHLGCQRPLQGLDTSALSSQGGAAAMDSNLAFGSFDRGICDRTVRQGHELNESYSRTPFHLRSPLSSPPGGTPSLAGANMWSGAESVGACGCGSPLDSCNGGNHVAEPESEADAGSAGITPANTSRSDAATMAVVENTRLRRELESLHELAAAQREATAMQLKFGGSMASTEGRGTLQEMAAAHLRAVAEKIKTPSPLASSEYSGRGALQAMAAAHLRAVAEKFKTPSPTASAMSPLDAARVGCSGRSLGVQRSQSASFLGAGHMLSSSKVTDRRMIAPSLGVVS